MTQASYTIETPGVDAEVTLGGGGVELSITASDYFVSSEEADAGNISASLVLTPRQARKMAQALLAMADQMEDEEQQ